jgi:hypothetical protein
VGAAEHGARSVDAYSSVLRSRIDILYYAHDKKICYPPLFSLLSI